MNQIARNGPWLLAVTTKSNSLGSILLSKDVKRYAKFEVIVNTELEILTSLSFLLLIEVAISDPSNPVLSRAAKNILGRFPSWMHLHDDSDDQATPDLYIPKSTGGKFVNAIVGEDLDNFDRQIDLFRINSFIERANIDQLAWIYSSTNVSNIFNKVLHNEIEFGRVDNVVDFYNSNVSDHIFYHNPLNREILTLKEYPGIVIKSENTGNITELTQTPVLKFNWFDEMGVRVGLSRLHLESNVSYRSRILDVLKNPNGADVESFKKVLRRELNLWKTFGATPDSNHLGATPEILEISDMEYSTPYFTADGNPTDLFKKIVEDLNIKYPTNWGYFRLDDSIWDYAGDDNEGVSRIHSRYYDDDDVTSTPYYQPGVGDLNDVNLFVQNFDATPKFFETTIVAKGKKNVGSSLKYEPVKLEYQYYGSYEITEQDNQAATVNLTLEFDATPHGSYATPITFYSPVTIYPKNNFSPIHSAYPEYYPIEIFDTEGFVSSIYELKEKINLSRYKNTKSSIDIPRLEYKNIQNIILKNGLWTGTTYATPNIDTFEAKFSHRNNTLVYNSNLLSATPNFAPSTKVQVLSNIYNKVQKIKYTNPQSSIISINDVATPPKPYSIDHNRIVSNIIMPVDATPKQIFIKNTFNDSILSEYGGLSYYSEMDKDIIIPSSPNIKLTFNSSNLSTPISNSQIGSATINSGSATASYYFTEINYPYTSTPNAILVETQNSSLYPFEVINWEPFELTHATPISGYVDEYGIIKYDASKGEYVPGKNSDSILIPEITREKFGLSGSEKFKYFFENIEIIDPPNLDVSIWSEQKIVNPFLNRTYVLEYDKISEIYQDLDYTTKSLNYPDNSIYESYDLQRNTTVFKNFIVRGKLFDSKLESKINTGWIHLDQKEYYVYAKPVTNSLSGKLKTITINEVPKQGAPIIVDVSSPGSATPENYREIAFPHESSPRHFGFYNTEILQPRFDNSFYLGYKDVYDISITDGYTGELLFSNLYTQNSFLQIDKSTYAFIKNRDYNIKYRVKNSYYIDTVLSSSSPFYYSSIVFDATPNATMNYKVTYESSAYESSTPVDLNFGQTDSFLDKGYAIVSNKVYPFNRVQLHISPGYILNDKKDFITISIISLDELDNPKPYQSFIISSEIHQLKFDKTVITTDDEGFASVNATYETGNIVNNNLALIKINGVVYANNPLAHKDSQTNGFSAQEYIEVYAAKKENSRLLASANPDRISSDGVSSTIVSGIITTDNSPAVNKVIYWRKARELFPILNGTPSYSLSTNPPGANLVSGITYSDTNGKFNIGPIVSQDRATPGYWFIAVESELASTPSSTPQTIIGDTTFWYESYDNVDLNYISDLKIPNIINHDVNNSLDIYSTPTFVVSYYDERIVNNTYSTPRWNPPKWLPIPRYEQYQAGYLGATPYFISDHSKLMEDDED